MPGSRSCGGQGESVAWQGFRRGFSRKKARRERLQVRGGLRRAHREWGLRLRSRMSPPPVLQQVRAAGLFETYVFVKSRSLTWLFAMFSNLRNTGLCPVRFISSLDTFYAQWSSLCDLAHAEFAHGVALDCIQKRQETSPGSLGYARQVLIPMQIYVMVQLVLFCF
jgi:hypothetical protein